MNGPNRDQSPVASPDQLSTPPTQPSRRRERSSYKCSTCDRVFQYKYVLHNHERTHTGEKPFVCPVCNKCFARSYYVKIHIRSHTGERPFVCMHCSNTFAQAPSLVRHLRLEHTGLSSHPCRFCVESYETAAQLAEHKRWSHNNRNNNPKNNGDTATDICGVRFERAVGFGIWPPEQTKPLDLSVSHRRDVRFEEYPDDNMPAP